MTTQKSASPTFWPPTLAANRPTLSRQEQATLCRATVSVIGCGGLGGHVIAMLARLGIGCLHCFDPDRFTPANCNRQPGARQATIGRFKARVLAETYASIHPHSCIIPHTFAFEEHPAQVTRGMQLVIDCLDRVTSRLALAALCDRAGLPLVHGAAEGWYGQVAVIMPGSNRLEQIYPRRSTTREQPIPALSCTAALVAAVQVAETVKLLLDKNSILREKWMIIDLLENDITLLASF